MVIDKVKIEAGENKMIELIVSSLPSGTKININAHIFRSKNPGPVCLVMGGMHGDEINGVEVVRQAIKDKVFNNLKKGTVIAIPLLNVYGFINYSRDLPDGKDINRSFPGNTAGSLASRVAKKLTKHILPLVDFGMDFHTGGKSIHNVPQIRIDKTIKENLTLAKVFGAKFIIKSKLIPRSLRKECNKLKIPILVFEGGESLRLDEKSIRTGKMGIKRVLASKGMLGLKPNPIKTTVLEESHWVRASQAGIFESYEKEENYVVKGDVIGIISRPFDTKIHEIKAKRNGYIFGINNNPVVNQGDALFHIGE